MAEVKSSPDGNNNAFSGTEGIYHLPHHAKEIQRLQQQHAFILSSTGGILITAPLDGKENVRVLDSGAADGTWLRDVARLHPQKSWQLCGADIGSALFPPKEGPNAALDLVELDIRSPPPAHLKWENSFDLVHQRLLIWGLQGSDWQKVLINQHSLLKQGGWVQLVEGQWVDRDHEFDATRFPSLAKMTKMQKWTTSAFGMNIFIAYELEDLLREVGFKNISKTTFELGYGAKAKDPAWRQTSTDMWIDTFRGFAMKWPEGGIPEVASTPEEFHQFLDQLRGEVQEYGYAPKLNYVVGQKLD